MKFVIHGKPEKKEKPPTKLDLFQNGNSVDLRVVDKRGLKCERGAILTIASDGRILLHGNISSDFGLCLDKDGYVVTSRTGI